MWKLVVLLVTAANSADVYGVEELVFFDEAECRSAAEQIEKLATSPGIEIRATCIEGLFFNLGED
jgi:hypothetical protein